MTDEQDPSIRVPGSLAGNLHLESYCCVPGRANQHSRRGKPVLYILGASFLCNVFGDRKYNYKIPENETETATD